MSNNPTPNSSSQDQTEIEVKSFKALPRDPNQPEHKKPRVFIHRPDEDPEEAAEARQNASYLNAAKTISPDDFQKVHKQPCVRDALLPAIGGGTGFGALRFIAGGSILTACNWASGTFCGIAIVAYTICQRQRTREKEGIRKAVQVLDEKQAIKDARAKVAEQSNPPANTGNAATTPRPTDGKQGVSFWSSFKFW